MSSDPVPRKISRRRLMPALWALVTLQVVTAGFFTWDIAFGIFGLRTRPIAWQLRELIELGAALGLIVGVVTGALALRVAVMRAREMEGRLRMASGVFSELVLERFAEWKLTPAEKDVAWFTVKGLPISEIARLRDTSEGTVKAQSNAIYRKAGVSSRAQLVSLFIEDLVAEERPFQPRTDGADEPIPLDDHPQKAQEQALARIPGPERERRHDGLQDR